MTEIILQHINNLLYAIEASNFESTSGVEYIVEASVLFVDSHQIFIVTFQFMQHYLHNKNIQTYTHFELEQKTDSTRLQ